MAELFTRTKTPSELVYLAIGRRLVKAKSVTISEYSAPATPTIAVALGRKVLARSPTPGWDDINSAGWRAIKLPIHDMGGSTSFVCVFGGDFDPKRAQATTERLALMLCPMIDGALMTDRSRSQEEQSGSLTHREALDFGNFDQSLVLSDDEQMAQLTRKNSEISQVAGPMLARELAHANSLGKVQEIQDQIESMKAIMQRNIEVTLDRDEELGEIEAKTSELCRMAQMFRSNARGLRRQHLMNQVRWGVAVGTLVSASIAIPIAVLVAA